MRWQFFAVHIFLTLFYLVPLHGYHNIMISHCFCWTQLCVVQVIQLWTLSAFGHCIWDQPGLWSRKSWKLQRKWVWTSRAQIWSWLSAGMAKQTHWSENFILENIGYGSCTVTQPQLHWIICVVVVQLFSSSQVTQSQRRKVSTFQWSLYSCPTLSLSWTIGQLHAKINSLQCLVLTAHVFGNLSFHSL